MRLFRGNPLRQNIEWKRPAPQALGAQHVFSTSAVAATLTPERAAAPSASRARCSGRPAAARPCQLRSAQKLITPVTAARQRLPGYVSAVLGVMCSVPHTTEHDLSNAWASVFTNTPLGMQVQGLGMHAPFRHVPFASMSGQGMVAEMGLAAAPGSQEAARCAQDR